MDFTGLFVQVSGHHDYWASRVFDAAEIEVLQDVLDSPSVGFR